ncbi:hypothetical protein GEMRC1_004458 [Eukaryota sp. GEM-RC1]
MDIVDLTSPSNGDCLAFHRKLEELLYEERSARESAGHDPSQDFMQSLDRALSDFPSFNPLDPPSTPLPRIPTASKEPKTLVTTEGINLLIPPVKLGPKSPFVRSKTITHLPEQSYSRPDSLQLPPLSELEKQIRRLSTEHPKLVEKRDQLQELSRKKQQEFLSAQDSLQKDITGMQKRFEKMMKTTHTTSEFRQLYDLYHDINSKIDQLDKVALSASSTRIKQMVTGFDDHISKIQEQIKSENDNDVVSRLESFVSLFKESSATVSKSRSQTIALTALHNDLERRNVFLTNELEAIKSDYSLSIAKLNSLRKDNQLLRQECDKERVSNQVLIESDCDSLGNSEDMDEGQMELEDQFDYHDGLDERETIIHRQVQELRAAIKGVENDISKAKDELNDFRSSHAQLELLLKQSMVEIKELIYKESKNDVRKLEAAGKAVPAEPESFSVDLINGQELDFLGTLIARGKLLNIIHEKLFHHKIESKLITPRSISSLGGTSRRALGLLASSRSKK